MGARRVDSTNLMNSRSDDRSGRKGQSRVIPARTATVVLPCYDVGPALPTVLRDIAVARYALRQRDIDLDVLVIDGGSMERSVSQVAADLDLPLRVVLGPQDDPGAAFLQGFDLGQEAGVDLVVTMDANGRHDATQIPRLVDQLLDHRLDVVIGSRWAPGSGTPGLSIGRWLLGRLANVMFRRLTGTRGIRDATTSFRVARTEAVRHFDFDDVPVNSHSVQTAFVAKAVARGYRVAEAPIIYRQPAAGGGGLTLREAREFAGHLRGLRDSVDRLRQRRLSPSGRLFDHEHFGAADDLEQLGTAKRFFDWVLDEFDPYLHGRVLEVGAGFGTITRMLADRYPSLEIVALEPADNMVAELASFAAFEPRVHAEHGTLATTEVGNGFDAVLYLNVLEHINDDAGELRLAAETLRPGGTLCMFGPAHEWLYSELDYKAGHYRRYRLGDLRRIVEAAGFQVRSLRYFDTLGVAPYWLVYRTMGHTNITGGSLWGYDRLVVPLSRAAQRLVPRPPFGKNVVLVATLGAPGGRVDPARRGV